jgi:hypothetical protein
MSNTTHERPSRLRLPFGFFAGPLAWIAQLFIGYALTPGVCNGGSNVPIALLGLITALVTLAAGVLSLTLWRQAEGAGHPDVLDLDAPERQSRDFIASAAFLLSTLFLLLIVATALYSLGLDPCPHITQTLP